MLEHFADPGSATGFKILAAVAIVMLIYGLAGLASNLQWCIETRREHKKGERPEHSAPKGAF